MEMVLHAVVRGIVTGLLYGSLIGSVAVGLTIIWGVLKVVNLAHGHVVVLAAMLSAFLYLYMGKAASPPLEVLYMALLGVAIGTVLYYASLHRIIGKADVMTLKLEMSSLMSTFGFGLLIYGLHYAIHSFYPAYSVEPAIGWSLGMPPYIKLGFLTIEKSKIFVGAAGLVITILAYMFMNKSRLGLWIRAAAQDSRALALSGVNPVLTKLLATIVATSIAMASGVLWLMYQRSISPLTEGIIAPLSFVIVVLGGLGDVIGTYLGGLTLGVIYMLILSLTQEQALALSAVFAILIAVLVLRPQGVFGRV